MVAGKRYNAAIPDIEEQHLQGLVRCDNFNRTPEELIPSAKGKFLGVFAPFYCEYGVNIHVGKECFINYNYTFLDVSPITLGDSVWIGREDMNLRACKGPGTAEYRGLCCANGCFSVQSGCFFSSQYCWGIVPTFLRNSLTKQEL